MAMKNRLELRINIKEFSTLVTKKSSVEKRTVRLFF